MRSGDRERTCGVLCSGEAFLAFSLRVTSEFGCSNCKARYTPSHNMSCLPPRDPRTRYPAVDRRPPRRQAAHQPLTAPLISSGWHAAGQFPANVDSEAGYVRTAKPMSSESRQRETHRKEYIPTQQIALSKDHRFYEQDVPKNSKFVNEDRSRIVGYYCHPTDTAVAKPRMEAAIKNGTEHTSCRVDTFAFPYDPTGDMLHRRHRHTPTALHKQAVCVSDDRCENRKPRHDSAPSPEYRPSSSERPSTPSWEDRKRRQARADYSYPTPPSPCPTAASSHRQREARPSRGEAETKEASQQEMIDADAVEEEITCTM